MVVGVQAQVHLHPCCALNSLQTSDQTGFYHSPLCVATKVTGDPETMAYPQRCRSRPDAAMCRPARFTPCVGGPSPRYRFGLGCEGPRGQGQEATGMHCVSIPAAP